MTSPAFSFSSIPANTLTLTLLKQQPIGPSMEGLMFLALTNTLKLGVVGLDLNV